MTAALAARPEAVAPHRGNICAVVVTYHPDAGVGSRLEGVAAQVAGLVVVDNSADDGATRLLREVVDRLGAHLVVNAGNLGVAAALNVGVRWAVEHGYRWVLTLDQDSVPSPALVDGLVAVFQACDAGGRIGAIGANWINAPTSTVAHRASRFRGQAWRECATVITSGTLLSLGAYATVGPYREDFFIDAVDHEYCLRLRSHGYRVVLTREALMVHPLGGYRLLRVLGMGISHNVHPPIRKYFIARNRLVLISEYAWREPRWALGQVRRLVQETVLMLLVERSRPRKTAALALGFWHFLLRRMGALGAKERRFLDAQRPPGTP